MIFTAETLIKFAERASKKVKLNEEEAAIKIQRQWRVHCEKRRYLKEINEEFFVSETLRVQKMEKQLESIKFDMEMEAYILELEDLGSFQIRIFLILLTEPLPHRKPNFDEERGELLFLLTQICFVLSISNETVISRFPGNGPFFFHLRI